MQSKRSRTFESVQLWLATLVACALAGCGALHSARVLDLRDVPPAERMRRPRGQAPEPIFVHTGAAIVAKRQLALSISIEPPLEDFLEEFLEQRLDTELDSLRVDFVGYRYAYTFPSRADDLVLRVVLDGPQAAPKGEFEAVLGGEELRRSHVLLGSAWMDDIPSTSPQDGAAPESGQRVRIERVADGRAFKHRLLLRLLAERLARSIEG